ncbi:hypothetical protein L210DRAFT_244409 [Boletus edulis BED1]|uniref:Uncharacterized protein n=1 Tax=Boletus edulis BED1 TaxID=1328754 RepID=A0AAD4GEI7_BOLED|nr:hypothetical protein L210DRAFT_244409 [Boletus edulis BED1]
MTPLQCVERPSRWALHLGNVADALKTYEEVRLPFANGIVQRSRDVGPYYSFSSHEMARFLPTASRKNWIICANRSRMHGRGRASGYGVTQSAGVQSVVCSQSCRQSRKTQAMSSWK